MSTKGIIMGIIIVAALAFFFYFLPALIASSYKRKNTTAIFVLNFLLGWTGLGWVLALIWAFIE
jgi:uncharacterized protein with PQ loop repeat